MIYPYLIFAILCSLLFVVGAIKEIAYQQTDEQRQIHFQILNGIQDQFFVDLGAYHPIDCSNTLNLKSHGWKGINIDGNYERVKYFFGMGGEDLSFNYAASNKSNEFVQFYVDPVPLRSTGSPQIKKGRKDEKTILTPSINFGQLCVRYFYKTPTFMNLDIEGLGDYAIMQNDWNNSLCRPEVLSIQINWANSVSGFKKSKQLIQSKGYKAIKKAGEGWLFIEEKLMPKYDIIRKANREIMSKPDFKLTFFNETIQGLKKQFPKAKDLGSAYYTQFNSSVLLHFAVGYNNIDLNSLSRYSNKIVLNKKLLNRPIVVFHFNPTRAKIIAKEGIEKVEQVDQYFKITPKGGLPLFWIYNHGYIKFIDELRIIDLTNPYVKESQQLLKKLRQIQEQGKKKVEQKRKENQALQKQLKQRQEQKQRKLDWKDHEYQLLKQKLLQKQFELNQQIEKQKNNFVQFQQELNYKQIKIKELETKSGSSQSQPPNKIIFFLAAIIFILITIIVCKKIRQRKSNYHGEYLQKYPEISVDRL